MTPAYYELEWTRGNTFDPVLEVMDGYAAFNLTGSELIFRVIDSADAEVVRISTADVGSGIAITSAANGEVTFDISYTVTRAAPTRGLNYAIERRISGTQKTLLYGPLKVITDANDD